MPELDSLTFDIGMNTTEFEQGAQNIEAVLRQLMGGAFQSLAQATEGIAQSLLGVVGNGDAMGSALTQSGNAATTAIQNVTKATRNTEAQTQTTTSRIGALWEMAARRISFSMRSAMSSFVGPLAAIFGIHQLFSQYTRTADRLGKFAHDFDPSLKIEDLQAWGEATTRQGGSSEAFQASLKMLNRQMQMFGVKGKKGTPMGGGFIKSILDEMKIKPTENGKVKDVLKILTEISGAAEKMDKATFSGLASKLRLDQGTIRLLRMGRSEMEKLIERQKALGGYTEKDAKITANFNDALADLTQVFRVLAAVVLRTVTPVLTAVANVLTNLIVILRQHGDAIKTILLLIAGQYLYGVFPRLILSFKTIGLQLTGLYWKYFNILSRTTAATVVSLKTITFSVATLKAAFMSLFSLLAAFVLPFVIEDIFSFFQGKVSYTGDLVYEVKTWPRKIENAINSITDKIKKAAKELLDTLKKYWEEFLDWVTGKLPEPVRKMLGIGRTKEEQARVDAVTQSVESARQKAQENGGSLMDASDPRDSEPSPMPPDTEQVPAVPEKVKEIEKSSLDEGGFSLFSTFDHIADKIASGVNDGWNSVKSLFGGGNTPEAVAKLPVAAMASQSAEGGIVPTRIDAPTNVKIDQSMQFTQTFNNQESPEEVAGKLRTVFKKTAGEIGDMIADNNSAVNVVGGGAWELGGK